MAVKTDIEIAQEAKMLDIRKVAAKAGMKTTWSFTESIKQRFPMKQQKHLKKMKTAS